LGDWSYQGTVKIDLDVKRAGKEIVLNSNQLKVHSATLSTEHTKTEQASKASSITYDESKHRVSLGFDQEFAATNKAVLEIKFQGTMNSLMAGFYRSRYKPTGDVSPSVPHDDEYHYMFSTQFEACDARRTFPCFDEPNLKASLEFEIEIPEDQTALSNMPEKEVRKSKDGWKVVAFEKSPIMSTYLFAWAFGDFEYVEDFTKRKYNGKSLPVRVYTTRGLKEQGRFALENCHRVVDYFSEIFQVDYPLPKVDLLACHEFSHGAMENWGLITYRTTAVLFDEKTSAAKYKNRVAYVVSHELAHQWFGNLVTMDWWNELWLNEGFATWVGWLAVDKLYPEWNVWGQFCAESADGGFTLDSIRQSHPIEVPVRDALEVDQIFDHISYLKGSAVIRMLSSHLGTEVFLLGVSNYLKKHSYSNATTKNLWDALSEASGKNVAEFMEPWIRKIGFPVITVAEEPGQITIQQNRFLISGDVQATEDETTWWIPLGLKHGPQATEVKGTALTSKSDTIRDIDDSFYKLNSDATGFYRTAYPAARLAKLGDKRSLLTLQDKIGLITDAAATAQSGNGTTAAFLSLIEKFQDEESYLVWSSILGSLGHIKAIFSETPDLQKGLQKFSLKLLAQVVDRVGWEYAPDEDYLTGQLRALVISIAGANGHEAIIAEAIKRFKAYTGGDSTAIHPSLRTAVFRTAIQAGDQAEYNAIKKFYAETTAVDGKEIALSAMGRVQSVELANAYLDFTFSPAVAVQDRHTAAGSLGSNSKVRPALWEYIKKNWDSKVFPELSGNMVVLERFLKTSLKDFASFEVEKDIESFFSGKDCKGFDRGLAVAKDTITGSAKYKERDEARLREWLSANGYL
jgi:aminopeptidase N